MNIQELQQEAQARAMGNVVELLATGVLLRADWEMDNEVWLVRMSGGELRMLSTSHGGLCWFTACDLQDHIKMTQNSLESLQSIAQMYNGDF